MGIATRRSCLALESKSTCRVFVFQVRYSVQAKCIGNNWKTTVIITSAKEVIKSPAFIYLFVCLWAGLRQNYLTDFYKILPTDRSWAMDDSIRFWRGSGSGFRFLIMIDQISIFLCPCQTLAEVRNLWLLLLISKTQCHAHSVHLHITRRVLSSLSKYDPPRIHIIVLPLFPHIIQTNSNNVIFSILLYRMHRASMNSRHHILSWANSSRFPENSSPASRLIVYSHVSLGLPLPLLPGSSKETWLRTMRREVGD